MMTRFSPSSGVVYQETLTPVRSMVPKWTTDSRGRRIDPSKLQQPHCDSLQSMALRACIWNIHNMEPGALQWLGWWYASRLYSHLKSNDILTFHAWNTFRKAYPEEVDRHVTFRVQEWGVESTQYSSVIDRLSKLDVSLLTFLCVRVSNLSIDHLVAITKIKTLAVLVLENGTDAYFHTTEKPLVETLRDWGRSVGESDSLEKLRVLVLSGYDICQINTVFRSISSFPTLNLIGIDGLFMQSGTGSFWGDWTNCLPQCTTSIKASPDLIWETTATTTASKMQQLYQYSLEIASIRPAETETRSISMLYSQSRDSVPRCHTEWFHRELPDGRDSRTKRPQHEDHRGSRGVHNKKLKVRDKNKVGMDSLLGSFM